MRLLVTYRKKGKGQKKNIDLLERSGKHMGQVRITCFPEEVLIWLVSYLQGE